MLQVGSEAGTARWFRGAGFLARSSQRHGRNRCPGSWLWLAPRSHPCSLSPKQGPECLGRPRVTSGSCLPSSLCSLTSRPGLTPLPAHGHVGEGENEPPAVRTWRGAPSRWPSCPAQSHTPAVRGGWVPGRSVAGLPKGEWTPVAPACVGDVGVCEGGRGCWPAVAVYQAAGPQDPEGPSPSCPRP